MFGLQPTHLILILIVALIIFGPQRLPELGRSLGKSINEFRNASRELSDSMNLDAPAQPAAPVPVPEQKQLEVKPSENSVPVAQTEETKS